MTPGPSQAMNLDCAANDALSQRIMFVRLTAAVPRCVGFQRSVVISHQCLGATVCRDQWESMNLRKDLFRISLGTSGNVSSRCSN